MIDLTPERIARMETEIASLPLFGCWAEVIRTKDTALDSKRIEAFRRPDGWQIVLQNYVQMDGSFTDLLVLEWSVACLFDEKGDLDVSCEKIAATAEDIPDALDQIVCWVWDEAVQDDPHPGAWFLWWVWQEGL